MENTQSCGTIPAVINNDLDVYEGDLQHYFRAMLFKAKNLGHPYHNLRHMLHVTYECHDACVFYQNQLSPRARRNVMVAAMMHDFDHCGVTGHDDLNLVRAKRALREHGAVEDREHILGIDDIIDGTQFPYKGPTGKLSLEAQILREADAMQTFSLAWLQQIIVGLSAEMGITWRQMLEGQEEFIASLEFHTDWAKQRVPPEMIAEKIKEVRALLKIINGHG